MSEKYLTIKSIELTQPIGTLYIGAISAKELIYISYSDVRRIEDRDVEKYIGIQRPLSPDRVNEIKQYVNSIDATFPTSIIIAISSENAEYDSDRNIMRIRKEEDVAQIIDGQHRIAGLEAYKGNNFEVNVTIFIDMDIEDKALVFATINLKQTKVSKSLAYDLYEFSKTRSPQKTCHNIAKLLNSKNGSPFQDKIKILGIATGKPQETITQATFVERVMKYISDDPNKDRDLIKRMEKLERPKGSESNRLIFRNMFIDERDAEIARIIWNYFKAVEKKWPEAWPRIKRGNILNRTTGFGALMKFLGYAYINIKSKEGVISVNEFENALSKIKIRDNDFNPEKYTPGSSGEAKLYKELVEQSGL